uniref:Uncharacterized protein n=1 Tax=Anguilla anguilla TaxID=7936 RepID=A0A0E9WJV3_ANGAN
MFRKYRDLYLHLSFKRYTLIFSLFKNITQCGFQELR